MVEYAHQICWISNTYYLPPGTAPLTRDQPREQILVYYQVSFFIVFLHIAKETCKNIVTMAHSMHFYLLHVVGVVSFWWGTRDYSKTLFGKLVGVISFRDMTTSALCLENFNPKSWYIWCCVHWMQYRQQCEIEDKCLFTYKLSPVELVSFKELITHKAVKHDVTATDKDW